MQFNSNDLLSSVFGSPNTALFSIIWDILDPSTYFHGCSDMNDLIEVFNESSGFECQGVFIPRLSTIDGAAFLPTKLRSIPNLYKYLRIAKCEYKPKSRSEYLRKKVSFG